MQQKSNKKFWILLITINAIILSAMLLGWHMRKAYRIEHNEEQHLIGLSYMTMNNEFYKIISEEINAKIEAEGDRKVLRDPALDVNRQIEQINEMLDTDVSDPELVNCSILSDNYQAGVIVGEYFLEQCDEGNVVIMTHEKAASGRKRVQGFKDVIAENPAIKIVAEVECEGQLEIAMPKMQELIDSKVSFDQVFCLNDLASVGVVAALEENHLEKKVGVFGVDGSPDAKALIQEGIMNATAAQYPSVIGKKAAGAIYELLDGGVVEKEILVPVELLTEDNVEKLGIDRWQ